MKRDKRRSSRRLPVLLGEGALTYAVMLILGFAFAQIHRYPFSHAVFIFVAVFPIICVLMLLISLPAVDASAQYNTVNVQRGKKGRCAVLIRNRSIIPMSALLVLSVPENGGERKLRYISKRVYLPPLSRTVVDADVRFDRIGTFNIGTEAIYLYDALRFIRVKRRVKAISVARIMPSILDVNGIFADNIGDEGESSQNLEHSVSYDYADVREYRAGDSIKRIHWKLSTKSDELQVKKYSSVSENSVFVMCDLDFDLTESIITPSAICEAEDIAIEEALAVISEGKERGMSGNALVRLRNEKSLRVSFAEGETVTEVAYAFSGINAFAERENDIAVLTEATKTVCVIPFINISQTKKAFEISKNMSFGELLVCLCDIGRLMPKEAQEAYKAELEKALSALTKNGISSIILKRGEGML